MSLNKFKISFLLILVGLLALFGFRKNEARIIRASDIHFIESDFKFSSKDSVNKLLTQTDIFSNKILKSNLNLKGIEQQILLNKYIDFANVSISVDGKVGIKIIEKNPVFRVLNDRYYIDAIGSAKLRLEMPWASSHRCSICCRLCASNADIICVPLIKASPSLGPKAMGDHPFSWSTAAAGRAVHWP